MDVLLHHVSSDLGSVLPSDAVYVEYAHSPCDPTGCSEYLAFLPHPVNIWDDGLIWHIMLR